MCSSCAPPSSSIFLPTYNSLLIRRRTLSPSLIILKPKSTRPRLRLSASLAQRNLDISWFSSDQSADGDYGGWEIVDSPLPRRSPGLPKIVIVGIWASLAVIVAAIAHFLQSKRGTQIIEDDVKADELCTRREYARWLVQLNSSLERNAKHRLVPSVSLAGSIISAFDDMSIEDPDFGSIQALAEAGFIPSKLSQKSSSYDGLNGHGNIKFSPERFISRQDLIEWKACLEYDFLPGIIEKSRYQPQQQ